MVNLQVFSSKVQFIASRKVLTDLLSYSITGALVILIFFCFKKSGHYPWGTHSFCTEKFAGQGLKSVLSEVYFGLTFLLTALTSLYFFNSLGVRSSASMGVGILFAFLPFHFNHGCDPLAYSYFLVPLQTLTLLEVYRGKGRSWFLLGVPLLSVCLSIQYVIFYVQLCGMAGVGAAVCRRSLAPLLLSGRLIFLTGLSFFILFGLGLHPDFCEGMKVTHVPADSELFGFSLDSFLLPHPGHPIRAFSKLRSRFWSPLMPSEGLSDTLGLIGVLGFVSLLFQLFMPRMGKLGLKELSVDRALANLTLIAIFLGMMGGLGSAFAYFVTPVFPFGNRISIYIAFFSLVAFACILNKLYERMDAMQTSRGMKSCIQWGIAGLILLIGILDQVGSLLR